MKDLTVVAIPFYFGSMGAEYVFLHNKEAKEPPSVSRIGRDISAGVYERPDTIASLTMGVGSLVMPLVMPRLLRPFTPGRGKLGRALLLTALGAAAVTTIADEIAKRSESAEKTRRAERARRVASVGGVTAVVTGGVALTTFWTDRTSISRMWDRRVVNDAGGGPAAVAAAVLGWDFIYYWNHRFMHECRALWAVHVVHHSSERYNLSTALRQPVADALGAYVPYSLLALFGIRPQLINTARSVNLIYQFWIHTETVDSLGPAEATLNTPSHHRVHHGSNGKYLDRNHGSILIIWDRLFGTFEKEDEPVRYGLTKNINTFNPLRIASHEHAEMLSDVARSTNWKDRLSFVLRGPGWAASRREAQRTVSGTSVGYSPVRQAKQ